MAVKHIKLGDRNVDQGASHRRLQSVAREISIMHHQPLAQHPHILQLLGYGWKLEGTVPLPYVIVEYGIGGDLRSYLQGRTQSSLKAKILHCGDVACGLMALHQCGIVHGDLKLNNVIVFQSWERPSGTIAKLCDFGHSILVAVQNANHSRYVGTTLWVRFALLIRDTDVSAGTTLQRCLGKSTLRLSWEISTSAISGHMAF